MVLPVINLEKKMSYWVLTNVRGRRQTLEDFIVSEMVTSNAT